VNHIGLHLRVNDSLATVAQHALQLSMPFFQSFLHIPLDNSFRLPSEYEITHFRKICGQHFSSLYAHGSFWLNLADYTQSSHDGLWRQILLAQRLGFTHFIVHPGSFVYGTKKQGIEMVARTLNKLFSKELSVQVVLENTAHGNRAVGSDLSDLYAIRTLLNKPEKVMFCIDTAHAYVYGYDIQSPIGMQEFLTAAGALFGIRSIALVHLNDAYEQQGSFQDRHAVAGTGNLGESVLKMAYNFCCAHTIPMITEPPHMSEKDLEILYKNIKNWRT
jgi:deoxyribonuclease IV